MPNKESNSPGRVGLLRAVDIAATALIIALASALSLAALGFIIRLIVASFTIGYHLFR
jgi:hypothetical protein